MVDAPKIQLTPALIEGFVASLLSERLDEPAPTPDCHREWWELCCSKHKRVAIAAPRSHAKSTAITKAYVMAAAFFRDRKNILIVSDTYKQSVDFLGEIKRELEVNENLKALFGFKELSTDREDEVVVEFDDGYRFRIKSYGSEQKVRGIIWDGSRPDLIIGDDLENDEMVMNPERRVKFESWVLKALLPCLSKRGVIRIVGTILHMGAFLEGLMPHDRDSNTVVTELKSYMKKPKDGWMSVRYRAHNEDHSKILWPVKWTKELFKDTQAMYIARGQPEAYFQEYLNRPIDPTNSFFRKEDFNDFHDSDYDRDWTYLPTYLSVDIAVSTKERRDYSVFTVGSMDEQGGLIIRHVLRDRIDSKEIVDTIHRLQEVYKFTTVLMGKGVYMKAIGPLLVDSTRRRGKFLHIEGIPEVIDKRMRATSIRGRMRAGGVRFNKRAKWYPIFEQEMLEFDRGEHDDQVDTMSLFGMFIDNLMDAPTRKEIDDIEYEEDVATSTWQFGAGEGRSLITGY